MSTYFDYRYPKRDAKCICCGKTLEAEFNKGIVFQGQKSKQGLLFLCPLCVYRMFIRIEENK